MTWRWWRRKRPAQEGQVREVRADAERQYRRACDQEKTVGEAVRAARVVASEADQFAREAERALQARRISGWRRGSA